MVMMFSERIYGPHFYDLNVGLNVGRKISKIERLLSTFSESRHLLY
jgi:hypothetical protein